MRRVWAGPIDKEGGAVLRPLRQSGGSDNDAAQYDLDPIFHTLRNISLDAAADAGSSGRLSALQSVPDERQ